MGGDDEELNARERLRLQIHIGPPPVGGPCLRPEVRSVPLAQSLGLCVYRNRARCAFILGNEAVVSK